MRNYRKSQGIWYLITEIQHFNECIPEPVAIIPVWGKEYLPLYSRVLAKYLSEYYPKRTNLYDNLIQLYKDFITDWIMGTSSHLVIDNSMFAIQPVIIEANPHIKDTKRYYENLKRHTHIELYWNPITYSYCEYNPDEWNPFEDDKPYDGKELFSPEVTNVAIASPESIDSAFMHDSPFRYIDSKLYLIDPTAERPIGPINQITKHKNVYVIYTESNDTGGIVDSDGRIILPPEFKIHATLEPFIVFSKDNYYGLYYVDFPLLIPAEWDAYDISGRDDVFLRLHRGNTWFYVDILGKAYAVNNINDAMKYQLPLITCSHD